MDALTWILLMIMISGWSISTAWFVTRKHLEDYDLIYAFLMLSFGAIYILEWSFLYYKNQYGWDSLKDYFAKSIVHFFAAIVVGAVVIVFFFVGLVLKFNSDTAKEGVTRQVNKVRQNKSKPKSAPKPKPPKTKLPKSKK